MSRQKLSEKFGCARGDVESILTLARSLDLLVVGFSFHVGCQCSSPESYYEAIRDSRRAADTAARLGMHTIRLVDIGGGFSAVRDIAEFEAFARRIDDGVQAFFGSAASESGWRGPRVQFIAEPGRFFAETTHTLLLNVIGKKKLFDVALGEELVVYYLNDGVYGSFGDVLIEHLIPRILPLEEARGKPLLRSRLFGPTCDSLDLVVKDVMLPELEVGDWCYVEDFGSYTTALSSDFNGFRTSAFRYIC